MGPYAFPAHGEAHFWDRVLQRFHMNNFLSPSVNQEWWEAGFIVIISKHLLEWRPALRSPVVFYNCSHPLQSSEMTVLSIVLANTELKTLWHWQVSAVWFYLELIELFWGYVTCTTKMYSSSQQSERISKYLRIYTETLKCTHNQACRFLLCNWFSLKRLLESK